MALQLGPAVRVLDVEQIYGGSNREPIGAEDGEFLVIAADNCSAASDLICS